MKDPLSVMSRYLREAMVALAMAPLVQTTIGINLPGSAWSSAKSGRSGVYFLILLVRPYSRYPVPT